ncbi:hypothetical protein [Amycolatopsis sp. lyj-112]|uniref:hypothetical protein n=1 Tax=Amycolatopsis sp. lyj-112 TaxID=2789288 RepID=UPI00397E37BD
MGVMNGQQIYENFANAPGPGGLEAAQRQLVEVRVEYGRLQAEITRAAAALEEHWQGDAAGAAQRGAGPLAVAHGQAGGEMEFADNLLSTQVASFHATKNAVQPVPPIPPMPASFDEMIEGGAKNYFEATTASNNAAQSNVSVMDGWTKISGDNGARMPVTYGTIDPGAFSVSQGAPGEKPGAIDGFRGAPEQRKKTPRTPGQTPAPKPGTPQPGPKESTVDVPKQPVPVAKGEDQTTRPVEDHPKPNPIRTPITDVPRPPISGPPISGNPNWLPPVTGPGVPGGPGRTGVPGSGPGAGRLSGPGAGRIGGPGTAGPGTGGGTGGRLGGGPGSGSGMAGTRGIAEPGMRGGAAGKPGVGGMAPGAAGQRGKGGEDDEHQRKYVLDDDSHFLPGEKGEKIVDPTTGMSPTPPVIGK